MKSFVGFKFPIMFSCLYFGIQAVFSGIYWLESTFGHWKLQVDDALRPIGNIAFIGTFLCAFLYAIFTEIYNRMEQQEKRIEELEDLVRRSSR